MANNEDGFKTFFSDEQYNNLPTVRITRVVLDDFKSVEHGEIKFNCYKKTATVSAESDILGVYGQNGSGKTALIEALYVLKCAMSGKSVPEEYAGCIAIDKEFASLKFEFSLLYNDNSIRDVTYSFRISKRPLTEDELQDRREKNLGFVTSRMEEEYSAVVIVDEKISLGMETIPEGSSKAALNKGRIISACTKSVPLSAPNILGDSPKNNQAVNILLSVYKNQAQNQSRSFIFLQETMQLLFENCKNSSYFQILSELRYFSMWYLCVEDIKKSPAPGIYIIPVGLPILTRSAPLYLPLEGQMDIPEGLYEPFLEVIETLNPVLGQLIPGLSIGLKVVSETLDKKGKPVKGIEAVAYRDGIEMPLRYESYGIRKLITYLYLYMAAFNGKSVTVAVDEFDSGVYEYLLGELVQIMEEYGKGQFIFTSHNLRPLEVLNKNFICFTTANPKNRYFRMNYVRPTNNLRDTYYREIIVNEQNEPVYKKTSNAKIIAAMKTVGTNGEKLSSRRDAKNGEK